MPAGPYPLQLTFYYDAGGRRMVTSLMLPAIHESVKYAFCMQNPGVCRSQGRFSHIFVISCHFGGHFVRVLIRFFWLFGYRLSVFN